MRDASLQVIACETEAGAVPLIGRLPGDMPVGMIAALTVLEIPFSVDQHEEAL
jgi:hypothetical protein